MGIYNVPIDDGSILQAVVADDGAVVADNLKKLKSSLKNPVVGVDLKLRETNQNQRVLVLSSRTFCLLVSFYNKVPQPVQDFMHDKTICFVAVNSYRICCDTVELGHLAARVLKNPSLDECRCLETLAGQVGVKQRKPPKLADEKGVANRCGILFSQEEIEFLIQNAYSTFLVADKLLGSLGA